MFRRIPKPVFLALISEDPDDTLKPGERKEESSTEWLISKE